LPTSRHLRSTRRTCSHRPCTLPPHRRSRGEAVHSSSHSYRRAPVTPLELTITTVPRPPSTAASGAPPAPSTPPVASPELGGALQPHRRIPPPDYHRCREPATVSLLPPFTPNRDHRRPGLLPGRFPADQRLPAGEPLASGGGGNFPSPVSLAGPLGRALLWAEPKCTVPFLYYLSNSFELIQIKFKSILNLIKLGEFCFQP
jgi:hypothetical protein